MTRSAVGPGQPPGAITLSGGVLQGAALKKFQPEYPPIAKAAGAEGAVQVMVVINETGQVEVAQVVSGHPLLREAALEAAKKWVFKPTELSGKPVKVQGTLTFNFTLDKPKPPGEETMVLRTATSNVEKMETRKESLGKQKFEGVEAEGERTVNTIPAGAIGNERPIEIVFERWYSPELQTVIMTRHSDPRTGENVYRLVNVNRSEPAAHLFTIPSDYTVKEEPGEVRTMMRKLQEEK
jgi:TonB family protein